MPLRRLEPEPANDGVDPTVIAERTATIHGSPHSLNLPLRQGSIHSVPPAGLPCTRPGDSSVGSLSGCANRRDNDQES